jgi:predicted DNA-binding transcriptional regulator AlpA
MRKAKEKATKQANRKAATEADAHRSDKDEHVLPLMLDRKQLVRHTRFSYGKILSLMKRGEFPLPRKAGRKNVWFTSAVSDCMKPASVRLEVEAGTQRL